MAKTFIDIMTITRRAAGAVSAHRLVDFAGNQAGADAQVLGVAMTDAEAGDDFAVLPLPVVMRSSPTPMASRCRRAPPPTCSAMPSLRPPIPVIRSKC